MIFIFIIIHILPLFPINPKITSIFHNKTYPQYPIIKNINQGVRKKLIARFGFVICAFLKSEIIGY